MLRPSFAVVLAGLVCAAGQDGSDRMNLQGTWKVKQSSAGGKETSPEDNAKLRVIVKEDRITVTGGEEDDVVTYTLRASKSPKEIDATLLSGPDKGEVVEGIYKIEGDTVTFCWSPPGVDRPTEFETKAGTEQRMFVLERVED